MLYVGLSLTLNFSFLFFDDENRAQYMLYLPLYYDRIYCMYHNVHVYM
jgi:hypothetical protein